MSGQLLDIVHILYITTCPSSHYSIFLVWPLRGPLAGRWRNLAFLMEALYEYTSYTHIRLLATDRFEYIPNSVHSLISAFWLICGNLTSHLVLL